MDALRRRLASCALVLIAMQIGTLFGAPISACCDKARAASVASEDAPDCCPPGAHPRGECPLHRNKPVHCRMTCGRASGPELLLGAVGVLPAPSSTIVPFAESAALLATPSLVRFRASIPDPPPPRLV